MNNTTTTATELRIIDVWFDAQNLYALLSSGHTIGCPLAWFPRLQHANPEQRNRLEIGPDGESMHWEELDEDISLESLFDFKRELNYSKL